jgi:hypothetical protein
VTTLDALDDFCRVAGPMISRPMTRDEQAILSVVPLHAWKSTATIAADLSTFLRRPIAVDRVLPVLVEMERRGIVSNGRRGVWQRNV